LEHCQASDIIAYIGLAQFKQVLGHVLEDIVCSDADGSVCPKIMSLKSSNASGEGTQTSSPSGSGLNRTLPNLASIRTIRSAVTSSGSSPILDHYAEIMSPLPRPRSVI
jgi:hypothetical protein